MQDFDPNGKRAASIGVRAGQSRSHEREHAEALHLTSSFVFESAEHAADMFGGDSCEDNIYSRFTNPTVRNFQDRLAAMEGGEACVATASGMSAVLTLCMSTLKAGDHLLAAQGMFGSTTNLFLKYLTRWGIAVDLVPLTDVEAWRSAMRPETKMLFVETPTNPLMETADIRALADVAHAGGALLAVDNCFCTPILQQPLSLGADVVMHSATKYLDGQGRCVGGALVGSKALMDGEVMGFLRTCGPTMSAFNAWVFLKGLETLHLRMRAHCESALALAEWLQTRPEVARVHYPGLSSHPQHQLAMRQQSAGGGMVSFELKGGKSAAWSVIDQVQMLSRTGNLGDAKTTITHPASTTHARISAEQRAEAGIVDGLIRVSVGLENIEDIQADIAVALDA
ncbi:MAG: O-succinylhomoserine sulfhydrylase [Granulosicoccaceae bacterium]